MGAPLRVLIVEDVEKEAELVLRELKRGGFEVSYERVDTPSATAEAFGRGGWDLVVSDYSMHQFDAPSALALMHAQGLDLPFIIVSGTVGEETAVAAMRAGAHDYFHKSRLGSKFIAAIERELAEARLRRDRAETAEALRRSHEQMERVLEHSRFVLFSYEPSGGLAPTFVSSNIEEVMGYKPVECLGAGWWERGLHQEDRAAAVAARAALFEVGHHRHEYRFRHKDGSWRWISDDLKLREEPQGASRIVVGSWNDVTELKQLQNQLMISDRMASIGTLAAGVGHEINNPLAALMANLDFAAHEIGALISSAPNDGAPPAEWGAPRLQEVGDVLQDAREAADRVRLIVRDLKLFSRSDEESRGPIDIRRVIESSLRMAWNEIRHRARLVKDFGPVSMVHGNEARLGQVFLNLAINAAQAMPEGRADQNEIRVVVKQERPERVVVEVRDTGSGIPSSLLSQIFDPFFTTKSIGVGTGLGLAICHRIITAMGGQIEVESQVDEGTVVRTILPVAPERGEAPAVAGRVAAPVRRGRILVIDDEPALAAAVRRMLSSEHEVLTVTSARAALERISWGERFDVILCDLMMPEMTGMDLHEELLRSVPEQAEMMIFMSGGAFTRRARDFLDHVRNPRLEKPFGIGSLRSLVHGLMS